MTPHTQTILACPERNDGHDADGNPGDCFRTAIASLLDLDPSTVPHFATHGADEWWDKTREWFAEQGGQFYYLPLPIPDDWQAWWDEYRDVTDFVILGGPSPRGPFQHVVVGTPDLLTVHDPHPSGDGLVDVTEVFAYVEAAA